MSIGEQKAWDNGTNHYIFVWKLKVIKMKSEATDIQKVTLV